MKLPPARAVEPPGLSAASMTSTLAPASAAVTAAASPAPPAPMTTTS